MDEITIKPELIKKALAKIAQKKTEQYISDSDIIFDVLEKEIPKIIKKKLTEILKEKEMSSYLTSEIISATKEYISDNIFDIMDTDTVNRIAYAMSKKMFKEVK